MFGLRRVRSSAKILQDVAHAAESQPNAAQCVFRFGSLSPKQVVVMNDTQRRGLARHEHAVAYVSAKHEVLRDASEVGQTLQCCIERYVMALPQDARRGGRTTQHLARAKGNFGALASRGLVTI